MTDLVTKLLLAMVALGIWANVLAPYLVITPIERRLAFLSLTINSIEVDVSSMSTALSGIADGSCGNPKLC